MVQHRFPTSNGLYPISKIGQVTSLGREVLAGKTDDACSGTIDKWVGGLHVRGKAPSWRWDPERKSVVRIAESD